MRLCHSALRSALPEPPGIAEQLMTETGLEAHSLVLGMLCPVAPVAAPVQPGRSVLGSQEVAPRTGGSL